MYCRTINCYTICTAPLKKKFTHSLLMKNISLQKHMLFVPHYTITHIAQKFTFQKPWHHKLPTSITAYISFLSSSYCMEFPLQKLYSNKIRIYSIVPTGWHTNKSYEKQENRHSSYVNYAVPIHFLLSQSVRKIYILVLVIKNVIITSIDLMLVSRRKCLSKNTLLYAYHSSFSHKFKQITCDCKYPGAVFNICPLCQCIRLSCLVIHKIPFN